MRKPIIALAAAALAAPVVFAAKDEEPAKPTCPALEARCPVSGDKINPKVFVEDKTGKVFFCCPKCVGKYEADPAKYAKQVQAQRIALAPKKVQVLCPVCSKGVDSDVSLEHHDHEIYFCCEACKAKFEKKPSEYEKDILVRCYTTQVACPVSGEDIDPQVSTRAKDGLVVYFCCPRCIKRFESSPDKYLKNLALGKGANEHPCEEEQGRKDK
jgi:YHS domain-containing protein